MLTVPFENLDIPLSRPIILDETAFYRKIVEQRRGGFCYELNGLFAWLLRSLGFQVTLLSAGVAHATGGFGPDFDHLVLLVNIDGYWLADVGFGDSFLEPLHLQADEQIDGSDLYRIDQEGTDYTLLRREPDKDWQPQYRFTLTPHQLADFIAMCHYQQTSPDSHFTKGRICSLATPEGRVTLHNTRLIITQNGQRSEQELADEQACMEALREYFEVDIMG
jgi:N-hydroxyarylamine O-acetyltransferase